MTNHRSTSRRRAARVALIGGLLALGSPFSVGHAFADDDWTNGNPALSSEWHPDLPASAVDDPAEASAAPAEDDWTNGNPALSLDWHPDLPASAADDTAPAPT
jgi:hypothetical protein